MKYNPKSIRTISLSCIAMLTATLFSSTASAVAITWTINEDGIFSDDTWMTGHFTWDQDIQSYIDYEITTEATALFTGITYTPDNSSVSNTSNGSNLDIEGALNGLPGTFNDGIKLTFDGFLFNNVQAAIDFGVTFDGGFEAEGSETRSIISGVAYGAAYVAPVPVPAAAWLFGSGLLGLIGVARRKKA